jgi:ABC-type multidrug transport system fused ATPase/permease subunit
MTTHNKVFWEFARSNPSIFIFYFLFLIVLPLQDVGLPHLYSRIVKAIQTKKPFHSYFIQVVIVIILIQTVFIALDFEEMRLQPKMIEFIDTKIMRHLFDKYSTNMEELKTGDIITKLVKIPYAIYDYYESWRFFIIPKIIVYTVAAVYIYTYDKILGAMFALLTTGIVVAILCVPLIGRYVSIKRNQNYEQLHEAMDDMLRNMPAILNADTYYKEEQTMRHYQKEYSRYTRDSMMYMIYTKIVFIIAFVVFIMFFFYRCYMLISSGRMESSTFVAMFTILTFATGSMWAIVYQIKELIFKSGILHDSLRVLDPPKNTATLSNEITKKVGSAHIELSHVSFRYKEESPLVLDNVSLEVKHGEHVLIMGSIGAGKSTILKLIMKYYVPLRGELFLDGVPYATLNPRAIRSRIGYVPQLPILFNRTIYENINYGTRHISRDEVMALVEAVKLGDVFDKFSEGLDTPVGKIGSKLSGGQRQIVWLFRVVLQNPEVLLLDEPTSSIDAETKEAVHRLIQYAMKDRTVIVVTHDPVLKKMAKRIITIV